MNKNIMGHRLGSFRRFCRRCSICALKAFKNIYSDTANVSGKSKKQKLTYVITCMKTNKIKVAHNTVVIVGRAIPPSLFDTLPEPLLPVSAEPLVLVGTEPTFPADTCLGK